MTTINTDYARQKLAAIARVPQHLQQHVRRDALWRIASEAGLFGAELSFDGTLTDDQVLAVEQHLQEAGVTSADSQPLMTP